MASSTSASLSPRIDVHSHFIPPIYPSVLRNSGHENPDGMPGIPSWSVEDHLKMMADNNITKSILSISSPGTSLGGDVLSTKLTTAHVNNFAADLKRKIPEKFGYWASLPLPHIPESLEEIERTKHSADGFCLLTNYQGVYLGDPMFNAVFERLNGLHATVFIHPTSPCTAHAGKPVPATPLAHQHRIPKFEFLFDTARAVANLFSKGAVERFPNITYILPHAGGCMPPIWTRMIEFGHVVPGEPLIDLAEARKRLAEQFYFDLAGWVFDGSEGGLGQLKALVEGHGIRHERLLYGSDYPFTQTQYVKAFAKRMQKGLESLFTEEERKGIYEENAKRLLSKKMEDTLKTDDTLRGCEMD